MMQAVILGHLLDKYEKSKHLTDPGTSGRGVLLTLDKNNRDFPEYDYEGSSKTRDLYNAVAQELEKANLISIKWADRRMLLMQSIYLNLNNVAECYKRAGRTHPKERACQTVSQIRQKLNDVTVPWILHWKDSVCTAAEQKYQLPKLCKENPALFQDLLTALQMFDGLHGNSVAERSFSIQCYHNSKHFEKNIQKYFLDIAEKYCDALQELEIATPREQLTFLGIYPRPELYEFAGTGTLQTEYGTVALENLGPYGMALPSTAVDHVVGFDLSRVSRILFIENKTNYDAYILSEQRPGELIVYQGGFLSPQKRKLFSKLTFSADGSTKIQFWADIDLGGFRMFEQLSQCVPNLEPFRMERSDVRAHRAQGLKRSDSYLDYVQQALQDGTYPLFRDAMEEILRYGVTIEQESFLSECVV